MNREVTTMCCVCCSNKTYSLNYTTLVITADETCKNAADELGMIGDPSVEPQIDSEVDWLLAVAIATFGLQKSESVGHALLLDSIRSRSNFFIFLRFLWV